MRFDADPTLKDLALKTLALLVMKKVGFQLMQSTAPPVQEFMQLEMSLQALCLRTKQRKKASPALKKLLGRQVM